MSLSRVPPLLLALVLLAQLVALVALVARSPSDVAPPPMRMGSISGPTHGSLPVGTTPGLVPVLAGPAVALGGATSGDAGVPGAIVATSTLLRFGCFVCADVAATSPICCAADPSVTCTAGGLHSGTQLGPAGVGQVPCKWEPQMDAASIYCVSGAASQNYSAECQ